MDVKISFFTGMDELSDCRQCLGGYYCDTPGAIDFDFTKNNTGTGICDAGYYCKSGMEIVYTLASFDSVEAYLMIFFTKLVPSSNRSNHPQSCFIVKERTHSF